VFAAIRFFLHQVKRSGIAAGNIAALRQNQFQQSIGIALRGKSHADVVQRRKIRDGTLQFPLCLTAFLP